MRIHERRDIVDQVLARLTDPGGESVIAVCGRPGCGKTIALQGLAAALAGHPGVILAHAAIRAHSDPDDHAKRKSVRNVSAYEIVDALANAAAQGMPGVVTGPDVVINTTATTGPVYGNVEIGRVDAINLPRERDQVGRLTRVLAARRRRLAAGDAAPVVVAVIDALDELQNVAPETYEMVDQLNSLGDDLKDAGIRIVIAAQKAPDWFEGDPIEVEATAPVEIQRYAEAELTALAHQDSTPLRIGGMQVSELARAIVRRADGLFIIAAGYLAEIGRGKIPDDIWEPRALPDAASYFRAALTRMRKLPSWPEATPVTVMLDTERFLAILATSEFPMTGNQIERIWYTDEPPVATSRRWSKGAKDNVLTGLATNYVMVTEETGKPARYALFHPTLREAILSAGHSHESISVRHERERYLRALTPLFPSGLAWDPGSRAVLREAPFVLAAVVDDIESPADPKVGEWLVRCATLVESWEWMECCLAWHDPSDEVSLGIGAVVAGLRALARMNHSLEFWANDVPGELAHSLGAPERRPSRVKQRVAMRNQDVETPGSDELAYTRHELIKPLLPGTYRFASEDDVFARFEMIRAIFRVSDRRAVDERPGALVLWVRGYLVTPQERAEGYLGNYMVLWPERAPYDRRGLRVVVRARKLPVPVTEHPVRNRPKRSHPDWGVWVLRNAQSPGGKKPHPYKTRAEAEASIDWLQDEYPDATSVTRQGRTGVLVYDRKGSKGPTPVRQFVLYVKQTGEGFVVVAETEEEDSPGGGQG